MSDESTVRLQGGTAALVAEIIKARGAGCNDNLNRLGERQPKLEQYLRKLQPKYWEQLTASLNADLQEARQALQSIIDYEVIQAFQPCKTALVALASQGTQTQEIFRVRLRHLCPTAALKADAALQESAVAEAKKYRRDRAFRQVWAWVDSYVSSPSEDKIREGLERDLIADIWRNMKRLRPAECQAATFEAAAWSWAQRWIRANDDTERRKPTGDIPMMPLYGLSVSAESAVAATRDEIETALDDSPLLTKAMQRKPKAKDGNGTKEGGQGEGGGGASPYPTDDIEDFDYTPKPPHTR